MIRQTEYASTTSTLVNCSNTYMYVQYHSLVLSENMCCSLDMTRSHTSSFILCSRLTIWWSRTPPCYYVQDVFHSILKCYRTTVTTFSSVQAHPLMWWVITPPSEGTMCSMSEYCYDSSHHGYSNHQRSGVYHPLQYSHIHYTPSGGAPLVGWHIQSPAPTVEHLHTGYKPYLVLTVVYPWHTVHHLPPTCTRYYRHEWFGVV